MQDIPDMYEFSGVVLVNNLLGVICKHLFPDDHLEDAWDCLEENEWDFHSPQDLINSIIGNEVDVCKLVPLDFGKAESINAVKKIFSAMPHNTSVSLVRLWETIPGMTDEVVGHIARALMQNKGVEMFGIEYGDFVTAKGAHYLAAMLNRNDSITDFRVDGNHFGDAGLAAFLDILPRKTNMRYFSVGDCALTDVSAHALCVKIRELKTNGGCLRNLDFEDNAITVGGCARVVRMMLDCDIEMNDYTSEMAKELLTQMEFTRTCQREWGRVLESLWTTDLTDLPRAAAPCVVAADKPLRKQVIASHGHARTPLQDLVTFFTDFPGLKGVAGRTILLYYSPHTAVSFNVSVSSTCVMS